MLLRDSIIAKAIRYVILNVIDSQEGQMLINQEIQSLKMQVHDLQRENALLTGLGGMKDQLSEDSISKVVMALGCTTGIIKGMSDTINNLNRLLEKHGIDPNEEI